MLRLFLEDASALAVIRETIDNSAQHVVVNRKFLAIDHNLHVVHGKTPPEKLLQPPYDIPSFQI